MDVSLPLFETLLNTTCYKTETVETEHVKTAFLRTGETKIELLETTTEEGVIAKYIASRGEGIHHIAFETDNLEEEIKRLTAEGFRMISPAPKKGADNKMVAFLHPRSTNGILIELCQEIR